MRARALSTIRSQNQSSANLKLRKYVFTKTWKVAVTASVCLKLNSGFHARKNLKEHYPKVVTFSDASFIKKGIDVYDCNLDIIYIH